MPLPKGFVDLYTAYNAPKESFLSIIGVVVDLMPATITRTGEYMLTFKLLDQHLHDSVNGSQGLSIRFFNKDQQMLPRIRRHGDVVLLRNVKMKEYSQQPLGMSNFQTGTLVFQAESIPEPGFQIAYQGTQRMECLGVPLDKDKLTLEEQAYVMQVKHEINSAIPTLTDRRVSIPVVDSSAPPLNVPPKPEVAATSAAAAMFNPPTGPRFPDAGRYKRPGDLLATIPAKKPRQGKVKLIKELEHFVFADIYAQVVKKFPTQYGTCDLYITDYTQNEQMFYYTPPEEENERERDGDDFGYNKPAKKTWPGPYGWFVLKINVKDPHAYYANREVEEGDYVFLRNVKMKKVTQLEGDMWPDSLNAEKVQITKMKDLSMPEINGILERKEAYWAKRKSKGLVSGEEPPKKLTRTEMKNKKKDDKKKKKKRGLAEEDAVAVPDGNPITKSHEAIKGRSKADLNPHVRCGHDEVPISSINDVLDPENNRHTLTTPEGQTYLLPFINARYRIRARVVDYEPKELEDFALPAEEGSKSDDSMEIDYDSSHKHEWCFSLLLEDSQKHSSSSRIWVTLGHEEAQYLFGNGIEDPSDLRTDTRLLAKLQQKLDILWGNLREKAEGEGPSNRPFECCLCEYGVQMDDDDLAAKEAGSLGFKRMYRMFGVTIL